MRSLGRLQVTYQRSKRLWLLLAKSLDGSHRLRAELFMVLIAMPRTLQLFASFVGPGLSKSALHLLFLDLA